jgi:hypothetical protein
MVSTMPSAVRGFTKHEAAFAEAVPSGRTRHCWASMQHYCAYMAPPRMPTTFPSSACAPVDVPVATTTPSPFIPGGNRQLEATSSGLHGLWRQQRPPRRPCRLRLTGQRSQISTGEHDAQIGGIDGRRFYPHDHIVGPGRRQGGFD